MADNRSTLPRGGRFDHRERRERREMRRVETTDDACLLGEAAL